ncbi:hypothetical protein PCANC_26577 [Puccinia coronata f. sp. avenae]|uniref:Uncharacterized protein n=1 Tax=Puccinia coronata f. sp. avenae TaxID=200324 RepID=A0A2N5TTA8_9BASI|nr:hypothetical protein PCANC_26577 [Puccinia coronata f. sp. avenae]
MKKASPSALVRQRLVASCENRPAASVFARKGLDPRHEEDDIMTGQQMTVKSCLHHSFDSNIQCSSPVKAKHAYLHSQVDNRCLPISAVALAGQAHREITRPSWSAGLTLCVKNRTNNSGLVEARRESSSTHCKEIKRLYINGLLSNSRTSQSTQHTVERTAQARPTSRSHPNQATPVHS